MGYIVFSHYMSTWPITVQYANLYIRTEIKFLLKLNFPQVALPWALPWALAAQATLLLHLAGDTYIAAIFCLCVGFGWTRIPIQKNGNQHIFGMHCF